MGKFLYIFILLLISFSVAASITSLSYIRLNKTSKVLGLSAETVISDAKLLTGFPDNFPMFPGSILKKVWDSDGLGGKGSLAIWEVEDEKSSRTSEIYNFYKENLTSLGWRLDMSGADGEDLTLGFSNLDDYVNLTIRRVVSPTGSLERRISVIYGKEVIKLRHQ